MSDPSFWYHERSIFNIKSSQFLTKTNILISSQSKGTAKGCSLCMAKNAQDFSDDLKVSLPAASIEYLMIENEIHETMFPAASGTVNTTLLGPALAHKKLLGETLKLPNWQLSDEPPSTSATVTEATPFPST